MNKGSHILFIVHRKELSYQIENTLKHGVDLTHVDILSEKRAKIFCLNLHRLRLLLLTKRIIVEQNLQRYL